MIVAAITFSFVFIIIYILVSNFLNKKFLNDISYITLIEEDKIKITCQNNMPSQAKKSNKKNSTGDQKSNKESLSFSPQFFNPLHTEFFKSYRNIKLLYTFCTFFVASIIMIIISAILLFIPQEIYRSLSTSFLYFGLLSAIIFVIIGFYSSCFNKYETKKFDEYSNPLNPISQDKFGIFLSKFVSHIAIPIISVFSQVTLCRFIPFGPFSLQILFNNNKNTVTFISFTLSLILSFSYISTTKLGNTIHKTIKNPPNTLYTTNYYKKAITFILGGYPAKLYEVLYNFVPTDVFFLFGFKFYFPEKVNDLKADFVFALLVFVSSMIRIALNKNMLQLIILRDSLSAMSLLDAKRTIAAWNNVGETTNMLLSNLPLNAISIFMPGFVNIVSFFVFLLSFIVEIAAKSIDELQIVPWLRIMSVFVIASNEISTSMQQFMPDNC